MEALGFPPITDSSVSLSILAATGSAVALYVLYRQLLPRPIPGIPYDEAAAKSLLGDLPSMLKESEGDSTLDWMINRAKCHPGGLSQIFMLPLGKPILLLSDYRETQDIVLRRSNEWDRSDWSIETLTGGGPKHHINMKTGPEWKAHRRLLQDLMMPPFLHGVAAPNIYNCGINLIELWELKARASQGRPFQVSDDLLYAALDGVADFSFGNAFEERALIPQLKLISDLDEDSLGRARDAAGEDGAVDFPSVPIHHFYQSIIHACKNIGEILTYPRARLGWWIKSLQPSENAITRRRYAFVEDQVRLGVERLQARGNGDDTGDESFLSAVDLMMDRETRFAQKEGRAPIYISQAMSDEIVGLAVAGHDTTATTLMWGMKHLTTAPTVQSKLRDALRSAHVTAVQESRSPSAHEITHTAIPYLDAVIEEILRLATTLPALERQTNRDTTLLGHFIPKGTTLFMLTQGPDFSQPGLQVDEKLRSPSSQSAAKERGIRRWNSKGMGEFRPERWLVKKNGRVEFDSTAGPSMPFGDGLRGCFGRRLAYLQIRIVITLVAWNFDLLEPGMDLMSNKAIDELTRKPKQCYVRLQKVSL